MRAAQTADAVHQVLQVRRPCRQLSELRAEESPHEASSALKQFEAWERVLLVGHEPHLSAWLSVLVADRVTGFHCQLKKAGVACVDVEQVPPPPGSGMLRWLLTPKQLTLIGTTG